MAHKTPNLEKVVQEAMEQWKVSGLSIALVNGDDIDSKVYGHAKLPNTKCTTDTLFDTASVAKTTTAAAVALLVDDDQYPDVQWTTPVSKLLPDDFVLRDPYLTKNITIEDILSHRTGIPTHDESYLGVRSKHGDNAKSMTRNLRNLAFTEPLRTTFMYSNIMYTVASHLVETISGIPYAEFLREKLWGPLGMANTFHDLPDVEAHDAMLRKATPYRWDKEKAEHVEIPVYASPEGQGAGSILTSASDYAKWVRALIKRTLPLSKDAHKDLVSPRTITSFNENYMIPFSSPQLYCLGLELETYRGHKLIGHDGGIPGFKSKVAFLPDFEQGLVIFANEDTFDWAVDTITRVWIDEVIGLPKEERIDWKAFFREREERYEAEGKEKEAKPEFAPPENPEPLGVPLEAISGTYHDAGYKDLVLEVKDGKLVADCDDRCTPFTLTFGHLTGNKFAVDLFDVWGAETIKLKGEIRVEANRVVSLGVSFEEDVEGGLIWFSKVT